MTKLATVPLLMGLSFVAGGAVYGTLAEQPRLIYVIDYMKVEPGTEQDYIEAETELWKPVHAERIRRGLMHAWSLYKVRYPDGTQRDYDYVTVNVFDSFEDSERNPYALFPVVHPRIDIKAVERRTLAARSLVRGELWYLVDHLD